VDFALPRRWQCDAFDFEAGRIADGVDADMFDWLIHLVLLLCDCAGMIIGSEFVRNP
jgi:hypothetical protein